jgi:hypothetical protein
LAGGAAPAVAGTSHNGTLTLAGGDRLHADSSSCR